MTEERRLTVKVKEPTQEQIKEFWEWVGFKSGAKGSYVGAKGSFVYGYYKNPLTNDLDIALPFIDLNNLFKYAVPKVDAIEIRTARHPSIPNFIAGGFHATASKGALGYGYECPDPALALFWAIWEVIHGG